MPFESMLVAGAVVAMFLCFALPLVWASSQTSRRA